MNDNNLDKHTKGRITAEQLKNSVEVIIETPQGKIVYKLNPLMDLNKTYRFKNKGYGYPNVHCGDFYVKFELADYSSFKTYVVDNQTTTHNKPDYSKKKSNYNKVETNKQGSEYLRTTDTFVESAIPFNLKELPDLIFATRTRLSDKFPSDAGSGNLNLMFSERALAPFANLAHVALIVDNYLIQFSDNGNMYILDIVKNTVQKIKIVDCDLSYNMTEWIKDTGRIAVKMMNAIDNNKGAQQWLQMYSTVLFYYTTDQVSKQMYDTTVRRIRKGFGLPEESNRIRIENREWYYDTQKKTWGSVAYNLFNDYFRDFMNYGGR